LRQDDFNGFSSLPSKYNLLLLAILNLPFLQPHHMNGVLQISFNNAVPDNIRIEVINNLSQTIYIEIVDKLVDSPSEQLNLRSSSLGVYYLKIQSGKDQWIERIVKEQYKSCLPYQ
jgi:hypothetical protein